MTADSTLDSDLFTLVCNIAGVQLPIGSDPEDGIIGASHHNVAAPIYRLGDQMPIYNVGTTGQPGWSRFSYVKFETTSGPAIAAKQAMIPDGATLWYVFSNDKGGTITSGEGTGGFAISAITDAYYGWIWSGGVCPEDELTSAVIGGNYATNGDVVRGSISYATLTADAIGLGVAVTLKGHCGFALAADA